MLIPGGENILKVMLIGNRTTSNTHCSLFLHKHHLSILFKSKHIIRRSVSHIKKLWFMKIFVQGHRDILIQPTTASTAQFLL